MGDKDKSLLNELDELDKIGTVDDEVSSSNADEKQEDEISSTNTEGEEEVSTDDEEKTGKKGEEGEEGPTKEDKVDEETETEEEITKNKEDVDEELSREDKLLAEIDRLSGLVETGKVVAKTEEEKGTASKELDKDFIGEIDMDDVASNPKIFNKILLAVVKKAVEISNQSNTKQLENVVPLTVKAQVKQYASSKDAIDEFYKDNPDLSNVRKVVKACAVQIVEENPEMKWEDILNKAAEKTRQTLGIERQNAGEKVGDLGDAAFAESKKHNRGKKKDNRTSQQKQIDEL